MARRTASTVGRGVRSDPRASQSSTARSKARSSFMRIALPGAWPAPGSPRRRSAARGWRSGVASERSRPGCRASRPPSRGAGPRGGGGRRRPAGRAEARRNACSSSSRSEIDAIVVRVVSPVDREDANGGRPPPVARRIRVAGVDEDPVGPCLEAVGLPQVRQLPPDGHEGVLQDVLGEARDRAGSAGRHRRA